MACNLYLTIIKAHIQLHNMLSCAFLNASPLFLVCLVSSFLHPFIFFPTFSPFQSIHFSPATLRRYPPVPSKTKQKPDRNSKPHRPSVTSGWTYRITWGQRGSGEARRRPCPAVRFRGCKQILWWQAASKTGEESGAGGNHQLHTPNLLAGY